LKRALREWTTIRPRSKANDCLSLGFEVLARVTRQRNPISTPFYSLQALNLSDNELRELPEVFEVLSDLRVLVLDSNHFTGFPPIITRLTGLEVLQFSRNKVVEMPEDIGSLVGLQELIMDSNELTEVCVQRPPAPMLTRNLQVGRTSLTPAGTALKGEHACTGDGF